MALFRRRPERIGLALGGGGVRGPAHVGAIRALREAGIEADVVTGTSIGAAIGAACAAGLASSDMSRLVRTLSWPKVIGLSFRGRLSLFDTAPLAKFLERAIGSRSFEDLPRSFAAIATDILNGERVVLTSGSVSRAVQASAAIPGFFSPVEIDGRLLVDGGVVDNLPVQAARDLGADYVIAVDVISPVMAFDRPTNPLEVMLRATNIRSRRTNPPPESIDCYVNPDLSDLSWSSFSHADVQEERGYAAMQAKVEGILKDLGR